MNLRRPFGLLPPRPRNPRRLLVVQGILDALEAPHTSEQLADILGASITDVSAALRDLHARGLVRRRQPFLGSVKVIWDLQTSQAEPVAQWRCFWRHDNAGHLQRCKTCGVQRGIQRLDEALAKRGGVA